MGERRDDRKRQEGLGDDHGDRGQAEQGIGQQDRGAAARKSMQREHGAQRQAYRRRHRRGGQADGKRQAHHAQQPGVEADQKFASQPCSVEDVGQYACSMRSSRLAVRYTRAMTEPETGRRERVPLRQALRWIEANTAALGPETVGVEFAAGRVLSSALAGRKDVPSADCAAVDGYAIHAADSEGASDYNPLTLALVDLPDGGALPPSSACVAVAGTPLPLAADAILPFDTADATGSGTLDITVAAARGTGVDRRGSELREGAEILPARRFLRPPDVALLGSLGIVEVDVVRQPRVGLVVAGAKGGGDALTPALRALVARDGGVVAGCGQAALAGAVAGADLVLVAGRSGAGVDDAAAAGIRASGGRLSFHGVAMRPGDTAGLGQLGNVPVVLLPGAPLACFAAYDMLAARAVRRMAGLPALPPYPMADAVLDRKIVSSIGFTDLVRVRMSGGHAFPLGSAESGGLASLVRADGFVIVPEASEGFAPGSVVRVHLYDDQRETPVP